MTTLEPTSDLAWANELIANNPVLASMRHQIVLRQGLLYVEVVGSHFEARAWRHAIEGRILPSSLDSYGVRRQQVLSVRMQVLVVDFPTGFPESLLPDWLRGGQ